MMSVTSVLGDEPGARPADTGGDDTAAPAESAVATGPWTDAPRRTGAADESPPGAGALVPHGALVPRGSAAFTSGPARVTQPIPAGPPVPVRAPIVEDHVVIWVPDRDRTPPPQTASTLGVLLKAPVPRRRRTRTTAPPGRRVRHHQQLRNTGSGLLALVLLALVATFFAWVSVEPMWLAVGHGDRGTATVTRCTGTGIAQRCVGEFTAASGAFTVLDVAVLGVPEEHRRVGASVTARMVSAESGSAYAGDRTGLHLRWAVGLALVLGCGLGIALATGATRLDSRGARLGALATSLAAPLLMTAGFLAASY